MTTDILRYEDDGLYIEDPINNYYLFVGRTGEEDQPLLFTTREPGGSDEYAMFISVEHAKAVVDFINGTLNLSPKVGDTVRFVQQADGAYPSLVGCTGVLTDVLITEGRYPYIANMVNKTGDRLSSILFSRAEIEVVKHGH